MFNPIEKIALSYSKSTKIDILHLIEVTSILLDFFNLERIFHNKNEFFVQFFSFEKMFFL